MARPRKQSRLVKLKDRKYWYIRDGRKTTCTFFTSELEAEQCLIDYNALKNAPDKNPSIKELLGKRMEDVQLRKLRRASSIAYFHPPLIEHFGNLRPDQLTSVFLHAYMEKRANVQGMLREELIELRATLNHAVKSKWIESAPIITLPPRSAPRERFITKEEAYKLLEAASAMHLRTYILIAMATAARKGAILGLTWDRVDLHHNRIDFRDPQLAITKKRRSVVPIDEEVTEVLKDIRKYAQTPFVVEYMGKPVADIKKSFQKACIKAELRDVSPHILKHSVISWLAEARFSVDEISDMTATTRETVSKVYRKFSPDYLAPMAQSLVPKQGFANLFAKL
ncbi:site-specific integrase [Kiloniella antarctica]|uniref:Site-specific integrase n=1 Tax=Kiloniella antarctica TaxID=1550907 RepID=A0ABW5BGA9_9PROT